MTDPTMESAPTVHVSLQIQDPIPLPREERRRTLERIFGEIQRDVLVPRGANGDLATLSVSGQTIEADLPADAFEDTVEALAKRHVRVDRLRLMRVAPPF